MKILKASSIFAAFAITCLAFLQGSTLHNSTLSMQNDEPEWIVLRDKDGNVTAIINDNDPCNWNYYTDNGVGNGWTYDGSSSIPGCGD